MTDIAQLISRAERLLLRLEHLLPAPPPEPEWGESVAFRWRKRSGSGLLEPVKHPHRIRLRELRGVDEQKKTIDRNTRQFVAGQPANNVLLTGARGTGKSSLVKAMLDKYAAKGLRLIEVEKHDLIDLPDIVDRLHGRPERFILFCDDLSFESGEPGYKALKAALDGSVAAPPENVLIYATSNRRHLMPEYLEENLGAQHVGTEVHEAEAVEEKISLSERFGIWLSFYPFDQDAYLAIVESWLSALGAPVPDAQAMRRAALQWALGRGSRSGRTAWQFARDWAGKARMKTEG
ncbi:MAG: ATP-binding protein [Sulfuricellaceae bacterium]|jgi:predicted AAA+ superfamily ATPase